MKIISISDTHGYHEKIELPKGDVLIHAGDISMKGEKQDIIDFLNWFSKQDFEYKIFIAGNHDFYFERQPEEEIKRIIPADVIYLNDSGTEIDGVTFWGSPVSPWFFNWAFNRHRGKQIKRHWDLIPGNTDILITHGPAHKILDKTKKGIYTGCEDLLQRVEEINPRVHICGHIHEAYGIQEKNGTVFINASVLDEKYELKNDAIEIEI